MSTVSKLRSVDSNPTEEMFDAKNKIESSHTSELVIALCGPIGSPLHRVAMALEDILQREFGYEISRIIRLSQFIEERSEPAEATNHYERVKALIRNGGKLLENYGHSILAELAVAEIALERARHKSETRSVSFKSRRVCHIINSIKNQEELELLRLVYQDMIYFIGVYSPFLDVSKP